MASVRYSYADGNAQHEYENIDSLIEENHFRELSEIVEIPT